jgi:hypothetical protein
MSLYKYRGQSFLLICSVVIGAFVVAPARSKLIPGVNVIKLFPPSLTVGQHKLERSFSAGFILDREICASMDKAARVKYMCSKVWVASKP